MPFDLEGEEGSADVADINLPHKRKAYAKGMAMHPNEIITKIKDLEDKCKKARNNAEWVRLTYEISGYRDACQEKTGVDPTPAA